jgi:hypothetical protein
VVFKPAIPATKQPQTYALERAAIGIGESMKYQVLNHLVGYYSTESSGNGWVLPTMNHSLL